MTKITVNPAALRHRETGSPVTEDEMLALAVEAGEHLVKLLSPTVSADGTIIVQEVHTVQPHQVGLYFQPAVVVIEMSEQEAAPVLEFLRQQAAPVTPVLMLPPRGRKSTAIDGSGPAQVSAAETLPDFRHAPGA